MGKTFCIFSASYPPGMGGVEKYTQSLAQALAALGHRAIVVTNNLFGLPRYEEPSEGLAVYRLPCVPAVGGRLPLPRAGAERRRLLARLADERVDHVVVNTRFYPHSLTGVRFAKSKGIRPVVIDHGSAYLTFGVRALDPAVIAWEHAVTTALKHYPADFYGVSSASAEWLKTFGIEACGVLSNSIDAAAFRGMSSGRDFRADLGLSEDAFVVAFTGRLIPEKGVEALVEAAAMLSTARPAVRFLLAGSGPLEDVAKASNSGNLHLLGRLEPEDVAALMQTADVLCLPTRSEGFSTSLLEAAACATTPVMPAVGGTAELMPTPEFGITLPDVRPATIATALGKLEADRELCRQMGEQIKRRVESEYSWRRTAERVVAACAKAAR